MMPVSLDRKDIFEPVFNRTALTVLTQRLSLTPVSSLDFEDLVKFKADPQSFSNMLGGERTPQETREELEKDCLFWQRHKVGMFTLRLRSGSFGGKGQFVGISGVHRRSDWQGLALRFAIAPPFRGGGMGKEAASATLKFLSKSGLKSVLALAREDNLPSRRILDKKKNRKKNIYESEKKKKRLMKV